MPARWPSTRGRWRLAAQRPLPSMMIATCAGSCSKFTCLASASSGEPDGNHASSWSSDIRASTENQTAILAVVDRHQPEPAGRRGGPCVGAREAVADGGNVGGGATPAGRRPGACRPWRAPCAGGTRRPLPRTPPGGRPRPRTPKPAAPAAAARAPRRLTSACVTVRMACATVLPVDWKALKSCVPRNAPAASRIASTSSGRRDSMGVAPQERTGGVALEDQVPIRLAARREARVKIGRRLLNPA